MAKKKRTLYRRVVHQKRITIFLNYLKNGLSPAQAQHALKLLTGKGLSLNIANRISRRFSRMRKNAVLRLLRGNLSRLRMSEAVPIEMESKFGFRYHVDFRYKVRNPITGEELWVTNTIGYYNLRDIRNVHRDIVERLNDIIASGEEKYIPEGFEPVVGSVNLYGFYRLV